jgi:nucleotide-binding universal stress UspA family protein
MQNPYRQLLVSFDESPHALQRLRYAADIAQLQDAAVTALCASLPAYIELPLAPEVGAGLSMALHKLDEERVAKMRAKFAAALPDLPVSARLALIETNPTIAIFAQQALYSDLMVLSQPDPAEKDSDNLPAGFVESVIFMSGKPALILPFAAIPETIAKTIVIAWKPSRESGRAVCAAMPLLQQADAVHICSWGAEDEEVSGARLDLAGYLQLHDVKAQWHKEGIEPSALGETLLSRAFDLTADLLVMGCYGHSRAREWILGGTSRTILGSMTLPVLMVH